jgi:hypothetical protein
MNIEQMKILFVDDNDLKTCNYVCIDECDHINEFKDLGEMFNTNEFRAT